jgi:Smg protein
MFDVLTFLYDNYNAGETCPEPELLERKLKGVGFEDDEISDALTWLKGLEHAALPEPRQPWLIEPRPGSIRIYPPHEQHHLGTQALGFIHFLDSSGVMPSEMRELVVERAMAAPGGPVSLDDLKIIILMVYWRLGHELDALVFDELCDSTSERIAH